MLIFRASVSSTATSKGDFIRASSETAMHAMIAVRDMHKGFRQGYEGSQGREQFYSLHLAL